MGRQKRRRSQTASTSPSRKQWHPDFSLNRRRDRVVCDRLFMELLGEMTREPLEAFLRDSEISGPSWSGKKVRKFFRETDCTPTAKLWVDHRYQSDRNLDVRPTWLFSDELAGLLREQVSAWVAVQRMELILIAYQICVLTRYSAAPDVSVRQQIVRLIPFG
jgi:hypothetical protein